MGDRYGRHRWIRRTLPNTNGERFVITHTRNDKKMGKAINFWHITDGFETLYTFVPSKTYNQNRVWDEELFQALLAELRSPKPSVKVLRFAVNGKLVFAEEENQREQVPIAPPPPDYPIGWQIHLERVKQKAKKYPKISADEPAPFILYGFHPRGNKEYAWKLHERVGNDQTISVGGVVLADTAQGPSPVFVTRIEPAEGKEQPTRRVIARVAKEDPLGENSRYIEKIQRRLEIEAEKAKEPAPFILYGVYGNHQKEYAWRLTPDKEKRQGIVPGDKVVVWTAKGWKVVTVTRIEPAEGKEQPLNRVKKKLTPEEV